MLASYQQVELVILAIGLALCGLWIMQFPADVPFYIINSPYLFSEYKQLSLKIHDLITGYVEMYVELPYIYSDCLHRLQKLEVAYAKAKPSKSAAKSKNTAMDGVRDKGKVVSDDVGGSEMVATDDTMQKAAAQGHRQYVPMTHYDDIFNY
jgi:hypothetical protein